MSFAVGLMSGTSLDGVDAALVKIDGVLDEMTCELVEFATYPYPSELLDDIKSGMDIRKSNVILLSHLNFALGNLYADAVKRICLKARISLTQLSFVASHGQTIYHQPESSGRITRSTLQLGDSAVIANKLHTTVVSNFREADMAVGGQGAPIVPFSEFLLYKDNYRNKILQNIGGIGNLTYIPKAAKLKDVLAFDTGPGNMIIDALCQHFFDEKFDSHGKHANNGKVHQDILDKWMGLSFFFLPYPKSTGRELFGKIFIDQLLREYGQLSPDDLIATATAFTAESIAFHVRKLTNEPGELIVSGGGAHNLTLLRQIRERLADNINLYTQEKLGYSSDAKEAIAMVVLGQHTLHHICTNVPNATGAEQPVILGKITYAE